MTEVVMISLTSLPGTIFLKARSVGLRKKSCRDTMPTNCCDSLTTGSALTLCRERRIQTSSTLQVALTVTTSRDMMSSQRTLAHWRRCATHGPRLAAPWESPGRCRVPETGACRRVPAPGSAGGAVPAANPWRGTASAGSGHRCRAWAHCRSLIASRIRMAWLSSFKYFELRLQAL